MTSLNRDWLKKKSCRRTGTFMTMKNLTRLMYLMGLSLFFIIFIHKIVHIFQMSSLTSAISSKKNLKRKVRVIKSYSFKCPSVCTKNKFFQVTSSFSNESNTKPKAIKLENHKPHLHNLVSICIFSDNWIKNSRFIMKYKNLKWNRSNIPDVSSNKRYQIEEQFKEEDTSNHIIYLWMSVR